jgi:DNA-binding transcriptional ArsR family regulator
VAGTIKPNRSRTTLRRTADAAPLFAALGDNVRLRLLERLAAGGPLSITRLTAGTGVTRQAVTKHLHVMAEVGLVRGARQGREQLWQLEGEQLRRAQQQLAMIAGQWDRALLRLKAHVEEKAEIP